MGSTDGQTEVSAPGDEEGFALMQHHRERRWVGPDRDGGSTVSRGIMSRIVGENDWKTISRGPQTADIRGNNHRRNYMGRKMARELWGNEAQGARADDPQKTMWETRRQMCLHHVRSSRLDTTFHALECDTMEYCQGSEGSKGIVDGGKKQFGHQSRKQNKELWFRKSCS